MKTKKLRVTLAGILSAFIIVSTVVPVGMVAHAMTYVDEDFTTDTVINDDVQLTYLWPTFVGYNQKCVVVINGNMILEDGYYDDIEGFDVDGGFLYLFNGSFVIINGDLNLGYNARVFKAPGTSSKVIVTGSVTDKGNYNLDDDTLVQTSLQNVGYVAESDEYYEHFTSGGKVYTLNGNELVETTQAAVTKAPPAPAASINIVNKDAVIDGGKGYVRYITELTFDPGMTVESFGTWFIPSNLLATEDYATVQYDGSAITSGQSYNADLLGIPGTELDRSIVGISFVNFAGASETLTTIATSTVNSIITGGNE